MDVDGIIDLEKMFMDNFNPSPDILGLFESESQSLTSSYPESEKSEDVDQETKLSIQEQNNLKLEKPRRQITLSMSPTAPKNPIFLVTKESHT